MRFQKRSNGLYLIILPVLFLLFAATALMTVPESAYGSENPGKELFDANCAVCHGAEGDSNGQVCFSRTVDKSGRVIKTLARDFTLGVFRFRTTPTGCLPTEGDLKRIVTRGVAKSFMPSFEDLTSKQKDTLVDYLMSFSERWEEEDPCDPIEVSTPSWVGSPASVAKGKEVYEDVKCWECHGKEGRGDGPKSARLKDDLGNKIVPFDYTTGELKRGTSAEDIYITFTTGLDGTGMPSYEDSLKGDDRWHLVSYTLRLMGR